MYNNITSNQAPGLNEYEKSVFLTKAQDELVKNHMNTNNTLQQGFDDGFKRQVDFSNLMRVFQADPFTGTYQQFDPRSIAYLIPNSQKIFICVNEMIEVDSKRRLQVIPLAYDTYTRMMSKPYQYPTKNQAWKLHTSYKETTTTSVPSESKSTTTGNIVVDGKMQDIVTDDTQTKASTTIPAGKIVEILVPSDVAKNQRLVYSIRYIKRPRPIRLINFTGVTFDGDNTAQTCELDESLHYEILQRAVELAKIAWSGDLSAELASGQRSE